MGWNDISYIRMSGRKENPRSIDTCFVRYTCSKKDMWACIVFSKMSYMRKKANYENRQHNFAGMDDIDEWFVARDPAKHRQNAQAWRRCNSDASRSRFVKQTGVRWSELLRLPYFDPVKFVTVDSMYCLF